MPALSLPRCNEPAEAAGSAAAGGYGNLIVIGALAFAGAYVGAARNFLRNLAVYDLSSFTFLKQSVEIVAASIFAMIAFAALPDPFWVFAAPGGGSSVPARSGQISAIWIALAPILGLMPRICNAVRLHEDEKSHRLDQV